MRQVPKKNRNYLVVGNGKMARHLSTYFDLLNLPYHSLWRSSGENIYKKLLNSEKVLVAISDDAITKFTSSLVKEFPQKTFIHFSGLLCVIHTILGYKLGYNMVQKNPDQHLIQRNGYYYFQRRIVIRTRYQVCFKTTTS